MKSVLNPRRAIHSCTASAMKMRPVVAADQLRRPAAFNDGCIQDANDIAGLHPPFDFQRHHLPAEFIADPHHLSRRPYEV